MAETSPRSLLGTSWRAEQIRGMGVADNAQVTLTFDGQARVVGSGGCNRYFGPVRLQGDQISFGNLASTRMACAPVRMEQERSFFSALSATHSYRFDEASQSLLFMDQAGEVVVRFHALTS